MKKVMFLMLSTIILMLIVACNNSGEEATSESNGEGQQEEFDPEDQSAWPSTLRLGAASVGGLYHVWGSGWASLIDDELSVPVNVEVTGGPNHNIQLIEAEDIDIGMATVGPIYDAWYGKGDWTGGEVMQDFRVLFPMYPSVIHWWSFENSGIESISDFENASVGVGPAGGTPGTYLPIFLDTLEIEADLANAGFSDMASQLSDGLLDVMGWAGGIPAGIGMELEAQHNMNWIGFTEEEADLIIEEVPYFGKYNIPAGTYETQEDDMLGLQLYNMAIAHKDIPDSLAYQLVDSVMNNNERMMEVHVASEDTVPENIQYSEDAYMHPGAIRWFEDNGYELPDSVYPD